MRLMLLGVGFGVLLGCGPERPVDRPTPPSIPLPGVAVGTGDGTRHYEAVGTVRATRRAELATRQMARIETVRVRAGDRVQAGQVLVTLERGAVAAQGAAATAAVELAATNLRRMERLHADSAIPVAQLEVARAAYLQAKSQADGAGTELSYATLVAPFGGVVASRSADPGDLATPGQPVLTIDGDGPREIVVGVPEQIAGRLERGREVAVRIGAEERVVPARITAVVGAADPLTHTVEVRLVSRATLPTGVAAVASLALGTAGDPNLTVPVEALVRRGELVGVFLFAPDSTVRLRWIRMGRRRGDQVEVVSGLLAGDVVVRQPAGVVDGTRAHALRNGETTR